MKSIEEVLRMSSPAPRPQALAFDGQSLWMGSIDTERIYAIDPATWTVREEAQAPGKPWGMTVVGDELRVICGETEDDKRVIRPFVPGHGFRKNHAIVCPDETGSQLGYDGDRLYVSQWYNRRILSLDDEGNVGTTIDVPHGICGQVVVAGCFYLVTTDDERGNVYFLTHVDARDGSPVSRDVATIPFAARALAYDGKHFWTNHREQHEIVSFTVPGLDV